MITRVKQFLRGIFGKITDEDYAFVREYLDEFELNLFEKLTRYEKLHTIAVGKKVKDILAHELVKNRYNTERTIKGALLHDIGKVKCPINIIEKSILVLLDSAIRDKLKKIKSRKIDIYYNHGEIGYEMLKDRAYTEEMLNIIRFHHNEKIECKNIEEVELVKKIDENT